MEKLTKDQAVERVAHYAWCRAVGHAWKKSAIEKDGFSYIVWLKCAECGTLRASRMRSDGTWASESGHNRYHYPRDYQTPGFKSDRADARGLAFFGGRKHKRRAA